MKPRTFSATIAIGIAGTILLSAVLPAEAVTRLRSDQNSCAAVQATIEREGAVIVQYPSTRVSGMLLYGRYVANRSYCQQGEGTTRSSVPAADTTSCRVWMCKRSELEPAD